MTTPLLQTKLFRSRPRPYLISRPRLIESVNAGLDGRLTLVSAPPGFGKTTLVAEWLSQASSRIGVAWYSLEESDNDPTQFVAYLIGALQSVYVETGRKLVDVGQLPPPETVVAMLINDLAAAPGPIMLVLDDYHLITEPAIHQAVVYLIDHMPDSMHLVIISRSDPPFSLSKMRVRRQLNEIRARDLRFTPEEASDFLGQTMGLNLSPEEVALLDSRTEGWVAGLQLAAHSLQQEDDKGAFLAAFAGDDRYIADYLLEEVLAHQPETIQKFLLHSSLLNRLNGPLCNIVLDRQDSQEILAFLEHANLFIVPLDNRRQWWRYHQLFADLLRERLEASPEEVTILHQRASQWYEENDFKAQAIEHALSAADFDRAIGLILAYCPEMFASSRLSTLQRWFQQVPEEKSARYPGFCLMAAWAWLSTGHGRESAHCLQVVEDSLGYSTEALKSGIERLEAKTRNGLIEAATIRLSLQMISPVEAEETLLICERILPYLVEGDQPHFFNPPISLRPVVLFNMGLAYQAFDRPHEAIEALEESAHLGEGLVNAHIVASALGHLAEARIVLGELKEAAETCRRGIEVVADLAGKVSPLAGLLHIRLAQLSYEWNELELALQQCEEGIRVAEPWQHRESLTTGYLELALIYRAMGQNEEALQAQAHFEESIAAQAGSRALITSVVQDWLGILLGGMESARGRADGAYLAVEEQQLGEAEAIVLIRIQLLLGEFEAAGLGLRPLLESAESGERWGRVVELLVLEAIVLDAQGYRGTARRSIARALEIAEAEGAIRTFVDGGKQVAELIREIARDNGPRAYLNKILSAFRRIDGEGWQSGQTPSLEPRHPSGMATMESLSDRELEVLQLIAEGLSNKEIAARLYLSTGTVKVHAHNIYGKLGVGGRTQALAKARELNILP